MSTPEPRLCAGCGQPFQPRPRGRPSMYCRPACRQRAWALRQAAAMLRAGQPVPPAVVPRDQEPALRELAPVDGTSDAGADTAGGRGSHRYPAVPRDVAGWVGLLRELAAQLSTPDSTVAQQPWQHERLYDALGHTLEALDAATPGGLAWLERHQQEHGDD